MDSGFERAEIAREIEMLIGREMLIREHQHGIVIERLFDGSEIGR